MNNSKNQYEQKALPDQGSNPLFMLIAIILVLFVAFAFMKAVWYFKYPDQQAALSLYYKNVLGLFSLPADFSELLTRPWTILTHIFIHDNPWKVFSNLFWMGCFGFIMQDIVGNKKIIPVFLYSAFGGGLAFLLAYHIIPSLQSQIPVATALGASAGVMGLAIATTLLSPLYRIFPMIGGGIPLWILTVVYVVSDLATIPLNDVGTFITHLSGALIGFLFIFFMRRGYDGSNWINNFFDRVTNLFNPAKPGREKPLKEKELLKKAGGEESY